MILADYYWLPRAGRFSSAVNPNDRLPIVFGYYPITPAAAGTPKYRERGHILPCINKSTTIADTAIEYGIDYCYSIGKISTITGTTRSIEVFKNTSYMSTAKYSLISSHYEAGDLHLTYIRFATDYPNISNGDIITAFGNGIATSTSNTAINYNPMDAIKNFLCNINSFPMSLLDPVSFNKIKTIFDETTHHFYGVLNEDETHWNIVQKIMGSYLGHAYINAQGRLTFKIETTVIDQYSIKTVIPKSEIELISARQSAANLINQCPISYNYSWVKKDFENQVDTISDDISQNIFGKQEPATPFQAYFIQNQVSATKMQRTIIDKWSMPKWEITFEDKTLTRSG